MAAPGPPIFVDANVLIDFAGVDLRVLGLVSSGIGEVRVVTEVLAEARTTDAAACGRVGIVVVTPTLAQILAAGVRRAGLSFEDHLCLLAAKGAGARCLSNDQPLRSACAAEGVPCVWGLEIMLELVAADSLDRARADTVAVKIQACNPLHISGAILAEFRRKLAAIP